MIDNAEGMVESIASNSQMYSCSRDGKNEIKHQAMRIYRTEFKYVKYFCR